MSPDTNRKYGGTGLGLSIVKQLVEMQGGIINLESQLNVGSTFTIQIPFKIASKELAPPSASVPAKEKNLHQMHILLAEDNLINQRVASKILEQWNTKITIANHGRVAIEQLQVQAFDLLLLDLQMPEMDGFETAHYIRHSLQNKGKNIPIIALTAAAHVDRQKIRAAGIDEYIAKPFNTDQLYQTIYRYLNHSKAG